jgi:hypothetical protein
MTTDISCFSEDYAGDWNNGQVETVESFDRIELATKARFEIRNAIAAENFSSGIDETIAKRREALDLQKLYRYCIDSPSQFRDAEVDASIAFKKLKVMEQSGGFAQEYSSRRTDSLKVITASEEFVEQMKTSLREAALTVERCDEELMRLNTTRKILLDPQGPAAKFISSNELI